MYGVLITVLLSKKLSNVSCAFRASSSSLKSPGCVSTNSQAEGPAASPFYLLSSDTVCGLQHVEPGCRHVVLNCDKHRVQPNIPAAVAMETEDHCPAALVATDSQHPTLKCPFLTPSAPHTLMPFLLTRGGCCPSLSSWSGADHTAGVVFQQGSEAISRSQRSQHTAATRGSLSWIQEESLSRSTVERIGSDILVKQQQQEHHHHHHHHHQAAAAAAASAAAAAAEKDDQELFSLQSAEVVDGVRGEGEQEVSSAASNKSPVQVLSSTPKAGPWQPLHTVHDSFPGVPGKYIYCPSRVFSPYKAQGMGKEMTWGEFKLSNFFEAEGHKDSKRRQTNGLLTHQTTNISSRTYTHARTHAHKTHHCALSGLFLLFS
ncbi:uncharacterized protein LOC114545403 [Perca flavescens]|uniref:uncharacterized protein LOC114545403 n=1 Tax=Perca flavescens TaxID=8167 RepID=UPI00106EFBD9|nr:uncharacterized protein LOC114545403 [Perca flavescens]